MKVLGRPLKDYLKASYMFFIAVFVITMMQPLLSISGMQKSITSAGGTLISILTVVVMGFAGWTFVRKNKFDIKQAAFAGMLCFLAAAWLLVLMLWQMKLSLYVSILNFIILFAINMIIYAVVAAFGGWLATKAKKRK